MDLKGAVALVTGGNGGLGQRICHALAQEGVHLAVMYARSRDQAAWLRERVDQSDDSVSGPASALRSNEPASYPSVAGVGCLRAQETRPRIG